MSSLVRNRTRGGYATAPTIEHYEIWTSCAQPSWALISTPSTNFTPGSFETMSDYVEPNFFARRKRGEIFFHDMSKVVRENLITNVGFGPEQKKTATISCGGVNRNHSFRQEGPCFARYCADGFATNGLLPVDGLLSYDDIAFLQQEISTKCLARRGRSDSGLLESVAEIRQTLNLIRRPFNSLNRLLSKASDTRKRGKAAAETWLQYRYGVLPIARDLGFIFNNVQEKVGNVRQTARASGLLVRNAAPTVTRNNGIGGIGVIEKQTLDTVKVRAMSLDEYFISGAESLGFGTKELVTLPWELIPYSFVADWFLNVGDFLNAIVPLPGVKPLGSCLVTERVSSVAWSLLSLTPNTGYTTVRQMTGNCLSRITTKTRTSLLPPSIVFKSDFRLNEATRQADAASLLVQRMDRIFK